MAILAHRPPALMLSHPKSLRVEYRGTDMLAVCFIAMASPCEVLLPLMTADDAINIARSAAIEAWRVEQKYSRYRTDSVTSYLNTHCGTDIVLDDETAALLDFAQHCYEMSEGLFDITSGKLRGVWRFDGSSQVPEPGAIGNLLPFIGFDKLRYRTPVLRMPAGMELDFGGIGKEYAVDRAYDLVARDCAHPFLVNFGGDLRANKAPRRGSWQVGIEQPETHGDAAMLLDLEQGALATSGDSHRYIIRDGLRYGHILNPRTGWPVAHAPRSVTVAASSCVEAGLLSTLAYLQGSSAEAFLEEQGAKFWILR